MKRNALKRIILWSIVIAVLVTAMLGIGLGISFNRRRSAPAELVLDVTTPPQSLIGPSEANATVTATAVNVRSSPSPKGTILGAVYQDDALIVSRTENVDGREWAYITYPVAGWVDMEYIEMKMIVETFDTPVDTRAAYMAQTIDKLNVRSAPSPEAEAVATLDKGETVSYSRAENINGQSWAYITSPQQGWVMMEQLELVETPLVEETVYPAIEETFAPTVFDASDGRNAFPAASIRELEIEWAAGEILITPGETDQITVKEDNVTEDKYAMVVRRDGDSLDIRYCQERFGEGFGISFGADMTKDLTITVPRDWVCDSLDIDAASATVEVNDLTIREVDFDGASGTCEFNNCTVDEIDLDTASGDIQFVGELKMLDCDSASASVFAALTNVPNRLNLDMMSGNLDLTLPSDAGFTLKMDAMNGDFTSQFQTKKMNGAEVAGDGACRINISALSGDVTIRKGE